MSAEHPLVRMGRAMTADPEQHRQIAELAGRLQVQLDAALACPDPTQARELLPAAVRELSVVMVRLVGGGLVPGSAWFTAQHARCYQRARALFGPDQHVVQPPADEPMAPVRGNPRA